MVETATVQFSAAGFTDDITLTTTVVGGQLFLYEDPSVYEVNPGDENAFIIFAANTGTATISGVEIYQAIPAHTKYKAKSAWVEVPDTDYGSGNNDGTTTSDYMYTKDSDAVPDVKIYVSDNGGITWTLASDSGGRDWEDLSTVGEVTHLKWVLTNDIGGTFDYIGGNGPGGIYPGDYELRVGYTVIVK
jgi:uncharacterized repeat protein (TIGR01451 family)